MTGRVLIADAVPTSRIILKVKLAPSRYEIGQAEDVSSLLNLARETLPDLIIMDQNLPGGGIEATHAALSADPDLSGIPVISVIPIDRRQDRLAGLKAGADEVMAKPHDEVALLTLVRNLIRTRVTYSELIRKQMIAREFGFAEKPDVFARQARIVLVPPNREAGFGWRVGLVGKLKDKITVLSKIEALDNATLGSPADVFVISAQLDEGGDGLHLVSELRSHKATRHAVIVVHNPSCDKQLTGLALDMGANAVLCGEFDGEELAARLRHLTPLKLKTDTLRQTLDQQLSMAMTDPLTGLYNRRYAQSYLARIAKGAHSQGQSFSLMVLDLDRFKRVNDQFGHAVGDEVLVEVARRLKANLREVDLLARLGGEEFLVAMPETDRDGAARVAERLRQVIGEQPFISSTRGVSVSITMSIGVYIAENKGEKREGVDQMIDRADRALYVSKADGRNQITFVRTAA